MKESTNPSAIRSKQEITSALLKLMRKYPYPEITVKQIVLETDLARKTFYLNYSSKDDVLDALMNQVIGDYVQALSSSDDEPIAIIFNFCKKNKDLLKLLHKNNMLYLLLLKLNEVLPEHSRKSDMSRNPFAKLMSGLDSDYLIAFNIGAIWNVIFKWVDRGMKDSLEDIRNTIDAYRFTWLAFVGVPSDSIRSTRRCRW